jgi:hypothetical protein
VRGTATQLGHGFRRDRLVREGDAGFALHPSFRAYQDPERAQSTISALVAIAEFKDFDEAPTRGLHFAGELEAKRLKGFKTQLKLAGAETPIALRVAQRPVALVVDPRRMLPTQVIDATREPKRALSARASALRSTGGADEARAAYREALALRLSSVPEGVIERKNDVSWWNDRLDGRIHLALAELALDLGERDEARSQLADRTVGVVVDAEAVTEDERWFFGRGADALRGPATERDVLQARLALFEGDAQAAYKLLRGVLSLDVVQSETDTAFDAMRKKKLKSGAIGRAGDYLVYAAAAHATGHEDVCVEAAREARRRGADLSLLDELHAPSVTR